VANLREVGAALVGGHVRLAPQSGPSNSGQT
jgi:hypothetical protein